MRVATYLRWFLGTLALAVAMAACGSSDPQPEWGSEAVQYFDELSRAHAENDFYGVLDFYTVSAEVEKWRGAVRGGARVSDLLRWNSGDLDQEILAVHVGSHGALTLVRWPTVGELGAIVSVVEDGLIARDTVFDHGASLEQSLRASPEVIATYEDLYEDYAEAWSLGSADDISRLYAPSAAVHDLIVGIEAVGRDVIVTSGAPGSRVDAATARDVGKETTSAAPAVYLGPRDYGQDPQRAVGVYDVTDDRGCVRQVAVHWTLEAGLIVQEHRYQEVESFPGCAHGLPQGWWTNLGLPGPRDQVVTGVVYTPGGQAVSVRNGVPRLEEFLQQGLRRFADAGMEEPHLDNVTFEPSRACMNRSGRVLEGGGSRDLFLCIFEADLCRIGESCTVPLSSVRVTLLHELGHTWMLDHVTDETRTRLLDLSERETWHGDDVPWPDRGVEYAAEVIAWGLLEEALPMVRIRSPGCEELTASFQLLTGVDPLRREATCFGP